MKEVTLNDDIVGCTLAQPIIVNNKILFDTETTLDEEKVKTLREYNITSFFVKEKELNAASFSVKGWFHPHTYKENTIIFTISGETILSELTYLNAAAVDGREEFDVTRSSDIFRLLIIDKIEASSEKQLAVSSWFKSFFASLNIERLIDIYNIIIENRGDDEIIQEETNNMFSQMLAIFENINAEFIKFNVHVSYDYFHHSGEIDFNTEDEITLEKSDINFDVIPVVDPLKGLKAGSFDINKTIAVKINDKMDARSKYIHQFLSGRETSSSVIVAPIIGMRRLNMSENLEAGALIEFVLKISDDYTGSFVEHENVRIKSGAVLQYEQAKKELDLQKKEDPSVKTENKPVESEKNPDTAAITGIIFFIIAAFLILIAALIIR